MKLDKPLPDGNFAYVHVISPVVTGADYTVMEILYDAFPNERQQFTTSIEAHLRRTFRWRPVAL